MFKIWFVGGCLNIILAGLISRKQKDDLNESLIMAVIGFLLSWLVTVPIIQILKEDLQ